MLLMNDGKVWNKEGIVHIFIVRRICFARDAARNSLIQLSSSVYGIL